MTAKVVLQIDQERENDNEALKFVCSDGAVAFSPYHLRDFALASFREQGKAGRSKVSNLLNAYHKAPPCSPAFYGRWLPPRSHFPMNWRDSAAGTTATKQIARSAAIVVIYAAIT